MEKGRGGSPVVCSHVQSQAWGSRAAAAAATDGRKNRSWGVVGRCVGGAAGGGHNWGGHLEARGG